MKYQTDYSGHIYKNGCLLCELATIVEYKAQKALNREQFIDFVREMHAIATAYDPGIPVLSDEDDIGKEGSFVWDHERLAKEYLRVLRYNRYVLRYTGRIYMPWEELQGKESFGDRVGADELILQIRTPNGGHFRGPNHDPWRPGTHMIDLKSIRYYKWIKL